jgi:hypothetical protein
LREWASALGIFVMLYGSSTKAQSIPGSNGDILYNNNGAMGAIPTATNGVLVTNGAGLPSISSTLPGSLTLPSPTIGGSAYFTGGVLNIEGGEPIVNWQATNGSWQTAIDVGATIKDSDFVIADKCQSVGPTCAEVYDQIYDNNNQNGVSSVAGVVSGGTGYATGDLITLSVPAWNGTSGWTVAPVLVVKNEVGGIIQSGGASVYSLGGYGSGTTALTGTITQASTTGSGTGASFAVNTAPNFPTLRVGDGLSGGAITAGQTTFELQVSAPSENPLYGGLAVLASSSYGTPFAIIDRNSGAVLASLDSSGDLRSNFIITAPGSAVGTAFNFGTPGTGLYGNSSNIEGGIGGVQAFSFGAGVLQLNNSGEAAQYNGVRTESALASGAAIVQLEGQGYDNAGTPVLQTWGALRITAENTAGGAIDKGEIVFYANNGGSTIQVASLDPSSLTLSGSEALVVPGTIRPGGYTVATLPVGAIGQMAYVTDAVSCTFLTAPRGGGSAFCPVTYNGSAWVAH